MKSDLSCGCYGLTPAEIDLMWKTAPPCTPIVVVRMMNEAKPQPPQTFKPADFLAWVQKQRALTGSPA